jgi:DNA polymerase I-like protein with 3'-5' exonuclease and polymerase domains
MSGRSLGAKKTTMKSNWQPPTELPDLRRSGIIALDTETNDEGLRADRGSAWPWHGGYVCGVSVAYRADNGIRAHYFPLRHPDTDNFDSARVFDWLKDLVASDVRFVTQNGLCDWSWLRADGNVTMPPASRMEEIGALATLVDENRFSYRLDDLCAWRGLPGKDTALLCEAVKAAGWAPRKRTINVAEYIHKLPAHLVGPYAEADALATLALFEDLNPILDREGTRDAYRLELDLLPMVHEMRRRGIRIDQSAAEHARDYCLQKRDAALAELSEKLGAATGMDEIASPKWKAQTFDAHKINYPRTGKGNPSFKAGKSGWMLTHTHWLPQLIAAANKYDAAGAKFLEGHILAHLVGGRIHAEINPHRSENGGTRSFRFSYSNPPLQQMPSRDEELAPLIRSVFLPEEGEIWCKPDISQQEFRFVVHHAFVRNLRGAKPAMERYRDDPDTDFHQLAAEITGIPRNAAKAVNFAKIYGAGVKKFAEMIGKSLAEAQAIYQQYDRQLPFVSRLTQACQNEAKRLGYTLLYDGARRHWDRWAPRVFTKGAGPCSFEEAKQRIRDPAHPWHACFLRRTDIHTALNALIQGSAARHTKLWMRACWRAGVIPLLQMHDALDCSVTTREQGELVARLACEAVTLQVPMRVDLKFGKSWGDATHTWEELHEPATPEHSTDAETLKKMAAGKRYRDAHYPLPPGMLVDSGNGPEPVKWSASTVPAKVWHQLSADDQATLADLIQPPPGEELHATETAAAQPQDISKEAGAGADFRTGDAPNGSASEHKAKNRMEDCNDNNAKPNGNTYGRSKKQPGATLEATFTWPDKDGKPHQRELKYRNPDGTKAFLQQYFASGRWVWKKPKDWIHVPYNLPRCLPLRWTSRHGFARGRRMQTTLPRLACLPPPTPKAPTTGSQNWRSTSRAGRSSTCSKTTMKPAASVLPKSSLRCVASLAPLSRYRFRSWPKEKT